MIRNMKLVTQEGKGSEIIIRTPERCPLCNEGGRGVLCGNHDVLIHDFGKLRSYINRLDRFDSGVVYLLECAIGNRISYIINDVPIVGGRLAIEEFLREKLDQRVEDGKEPRVSLWMERMLKEIIVLRKAKKEVIKLMNNNSKNIEVK